MRNCTDSLWEICIRSTIYTVRQLFFFRWYTQSPITRFSKRLPDSNKDCGTIKLGQKNFFFAFRHLTIKSRCKMRIFRLLMVKCRKAKKIFLTQFDCYAIFVRMKLSVSRKKNQLSDSDIDATISDFKQNTLFDIVIIFFLYNERILTQKHYLFKCL